MSRIQWTGYTIQASSAVQVGRIVSALPHLYGGYQCQYWPEEQVTAPEADTVVRIIPSLTDLAKLFGMTSDPFIAGYPSLLAAMLAIPKVSAFPIVCQLGPAELSATGFQLHPETVRRRRELEEGLPHVDEGLRLFAIPVSLGGFYRAWPADIAISHAEQSRGFLLDPVTIICQFLAWPELCLRKTLPMTSGSGRNETLTASFSFNSKTHQVELTIAKSQNQPLAKNVGLAVAFPGPAH